MTGEPLLAVAVRNTRRIMRQFAMQANTTNATNATNNDALHDVALTAVQYDQRAEGVAAASADAPRAELVFSKVRRRVGVLAGCHNTQPTRS